MVASLGGIAGIVAGVTTLAPAAQKAFELAAPIIDRLVPDPAEKQKLIGELIGTLQQSAIAQLEVNKAEAQSSSLFVSGWRPAIGWIFALVLAYVFILAPLTTAVAQIWKPEFHLPAPDDHLWELVFGMLGLGTMRSFEKIKGMGLISGAPALSQRLSSGPGLGDGLRGSR